MPEIITKMEDLTGAQKAAAVIIALGVDKASLLYKNIIRCV